MTKKLQRAILFSIFWSSAILTTACGGALAGGTIGGGSHVYDHIVENWWVDVIACAKLNPCQPIAGAQIQIHSFDGYSAPKTADADGYTVWPVTSDLTDSDVIIKADGYVPLVGAHLDVKGSHDGRKHNEFLLQADHVDPSIYSLQQLETFHGALFTVKAGGLPYGPRPNAPDNVCIFGAYYYTRDQRQVCYDAYKSRGYSHGVIGPLVDPGYHNEVPSQDFRDDPDAFLDLIQEAYDEGFKPIVDIVPDHWGKDKGFADHVWTVDELRALEPIFRAPRFQKLARLVMLCYECMGDKYGWSNTTYIAYLTWLRDVFPNAIRILHTPGDLEAPVGQGDSTGGCSPIGPKCMAGNGDAWARIAPLIHVWFHQSNALFDPSYVDPNPINQGRTNEQNWYRLWDLSVRGSFVSRFTNGDSGWPTTSANSPDVNGGHLCATAGEFYSFKVWWDNASEDFARDHGAKAVQLGACGSMDGWR